MAVPLRIAIADDHALVRQALALLLEREGMKVVGQAERADDVRALVSRARCDILLLDLCMDRNTLVDVAALAKKVKVIVLTGSEQRPDAMAAMRAGASAFVSKRAATALLLEAIRAVEAGGTWLPPELRHRPETGPHSTQPMLTPRECEIIRLVAQGLRSAEVAQRLFISEATVKTHLNNVFAKLGLRDRTELTLYAVRCGIVTIDAQPVN